MKHGGSGWIAGRTILCAVLLGMPGMLSAQRSAATFMEGQRVEVREGDIWSPATIIKQEGRRYQIRYEDGTEEWVATDRLRLPGQAGQPAPASPARPARPQTPAAPGQAAEPQPGQRVQAKRGSNRWEDAIVTRKVAADRWEIPWQFGGNLDIKPRDEIRLPDEAKASAPPSRSGGEPVRLYATTLPDLSQMRQIRPRRRDGNRRWTTRRLWNLPTVWSSSTRTGAGPIIGSALLFPMLTPSSWVRRFRARRVSPLRRFRWSAGRAGRCSSSRPTPGRWQSARTGSCWRRGRRASCRGRKGGWICGQPQRKGRSI